MTLAIAIAGAQGQMGRALLNAAGNDARFAVIASTTRDAPDVAAAAAKAAVWIDFTTPDATVAALDALAATPVRAAIVGATGLSAEQEARVAGQSCAPPISAWA